MFLQAIWLKPKGDSQMGGGLQKLDGGGNMVRIWWFWCDEVMAPPPSYMTQARDETIVVFECSQERLV